jgi:ribosomal protein L35/uncharacterized small protein (DUF1192 family)
LTFEGFAALLIIASGCASTLFYRLVWRPYFLAYEASQKVNNDAIASLEKRISALQGENERVTAEYHSTIDRQNKETERQNKEAQEIINRAKFNLDRADADATKLRLELSEARASIEVETQARHLSVQKQTEISAQLFNAQQQIKHLEDWSARQDENLEKQAIVHEADLTRINDKTAEQLAKMRLETVGLKELYTQIQEDQHRQGRELMELTQKVENARSILRRWGLTPEQIEGLLSGILDPSQVESLVSQEIAKHLKPPEPVVEQPDIIVSSDAPEKPKDPITPIMIEIPKMALPIAPVVPPDDSQVPKGDSQ